MRHLILIVVFTSFFFKSYSQDFGEIKIDSNLQVKYCDTLQNIGERLTGKWKYLGFRTNGNLTDTMGTGFRNDKKTVTTVENGVVFETEGNNKRKADYFYEITYSFENGKLFYDFGEKYFNENYTAVGTSQPHTDIVYYKGEIGIIFTGMVYQFFSEIIELTAEKLVLENGEEYLKIE